MLRVAPDYKCNGTTIDERYYDLLRLADIFDSRHNYVAVLDDVNRRPTGLAGNAFIFPVPSDRLREHCATFQARSVEGPVANVVHGP